MWRMNSRWSIHFMENGNHLFIVFGQLFVLSLKLFLASPHWEAKKRMDFERREQDISFIAFNQEVWNWKVFRCVSFHSTNIHTEFFLERLNTFAFGTNDYGTVVANEWDHLIECGRRHGLESLGSLCFSVLIWKYVLIYRWYFMNQFCCIE